jgi:hypothetical protein
LDDLPADQVMRAVTACPVSSWHFTSFYCNTKFGRDRSIPDKVGVAGVTSVPGTNNFSIRSNCRAETVGDAARRDGNTSGNGRKPSAD